MEEEIKQLQEQVKELMDWKQDRITQQITYPLDQQSLIVLRKYLMSISNIVDYTVTGAATHAVEVYTGKQDTLNFTVNPTTLFVYNVDVTSNVLTITDGRFDNDTAVEVTYSPGGAAPSPLAINTTYYVVSSNGNTCKLSATVGGSAINITDRGTGTQYIFADLL